MHLSWNFVVAHKLALNTRQLPSPDPEHAQKILEEHVTQVIFKATRHLNLKSSVQLAILRAEI